MNDIQKEIMDKFPKFEWKLYKKAPQPYYNTDCYYMIMQKNITGRPDRWIMVYPDGLIRCNGYYEDSDVSLQEARKMYKKFLLNNFK